MGILDDAIRQHLELKRRQGADVSELQRLEDEAFGPPSRPGEPDFPDREEAEEEGLAEAGQAVSEAEPGAEHAPEEGAPAFFDAEFEGPAEGAAPQAPASEEELRTEERAAEQAEADEDFGLGEIDLELDDELELVEPEAVSTPGEAAVEPGAAEPPIESLDTVEHHIEEAEVVDEPPAEEPEVPEEPPAEEPGPGEPPAGEPAPEEPSDEGEDVLEETPEFLRDRPEDDELWFEQGKPKDFDF